MRHLFQPVFDVPSTLAGAPTTTQRYRPAPLFDIEKGDFIMNGANQPMYGNGFDGWVLWCVKTILTQRFAHLAYSSNAGIEAKEAFAELPDRSAVESALRRTITEALLADPMGRTVQVRDFEFAWWADSLHMTCAVINGNGDPALIALNLPGSA